MTKPTKTATRKVKSSGPLYRGYAINNRTVDEDARTVELSFSSETTHVERWFGIELLDHSPKSIRLDRLRANGALLFNHNWDRHLGVIESVGIDARRGVATVRFGKSPEAEEKFRDVIDAVLTNVSFGYRVHKLVLEEANDDEPNVYRATDWEPLEISLVTVPADISVGVGRSAGDPFDIEITEERTMDKDLDENGHPIESTRAAAPAAPVAPTPAPVDRTAITNEIRAAEQKRVADLTGLATRYAKYGARDLLDEYIATGKTPDDLQRAILERLPTEDSAATGGDAPVDASLDLSGRDLKNYSLLRAINAVVESRKGNYKAMEAAAFEMECSDELGSRLGRDARGFFMPLDVVTRTINATTGADLVSTDHMPGMFIETLRPNSVVMGLGATVLDGLVGDLDIPKGISNAGFQWIGDDDDSPDTDLTFGSVGLRFKTLSGSVPMSRKLLKQSSPSVEALVQTDILRGAALGIDAGILMGTGTNNQPMGLFNSSGINVQTVATPGAPTWDELVGFETKVSSDNALMGSLAFVTTSGVRGTLKTTKKDAGSGIFLMEDKEANGYPVEISNQLTANRMAFGNWESVLVGLWGVLDINPDVATKAKSGGLVLRVFQDADVALRHHESFCVNG